MEFCVNFQVSDKRNWMKGCLIRKCRNRNMFDGGGEIARSGAPF